MNLVVQAAKFIFSRHRHITVCRCTCMWRWSGRTCHLYIELAQCEFQSEYKCRSLKHRYCLQLSRSMHWGK